MKAEVQSKPPLPLNARRAGSVRPAAHAIPPGPSRRHSGRAENSVCTGIGVVPCNRIQSYCDAIAREFRPDQIILFGSYAYGQPTPDSDVDLLVILPFKGNDVAKAIQIRSRFDTPFPLDLIVRKPEFIARRRRERDMFIELVVTQGRVMYESQHA